MKTLMNTINKNIINKKTNINTNINGLFSNTNFTIHHSQYVNFFTKESLSRKNKRNFSFQNFSKNSTEWMNRHKTDIYVKKSVEVFIKINKLNRKTIDREQRLNFLKFKTNTKF